MASPDTVLPSKSALVAAKCAQLPEVKKLFEELARRDEELASLQTRFVESMKRNRAKREGKPVVLSKHAQRKLAEFDRDAAKAEEDSERLSAEMDDRNLLICEISHVHQMIEFDEGMLSAWHDEDKPMAQAIIQHRRDTMKLIEDFVENSAVFKGKVASIWKAKRAK